MSDHQYKPSAPSTELAQIPTAAPPSPVVQQIPANWYRDTVSGQMRYWDGAAWTNHLAPRTAPQPQQVIIVNQRKQTNHVLHLLLTLVTAGLWIPVWIIVAIANGN